MSNRTFSLSEELHRYLLSVSLREPESFRRLREETAQHPMARMQIAPEQGQFMAFLIRMMGAKRAIEVGVFTGYSSLWIADALAEGGRLIACDVSEEWTSVARRYWRELGLERCIELQLRPAVDTLDRLLVEGGADTYDFAFIDADKENYGAYYERLLRLLRPGGVVVVDNVLWSGKVADPTVDDSETQAIRAFNEMLRDDGRVALSMVPIADGLSLAMKRP